MGKMCVNIVTLRAWTSLRLFANQLPELILTSMPTTPKPGLRPASAITRYEHFCNVTMSTDSLQLATLPMLASLGLRA